MGLPNTGLASMFAMLNTARIGVGVQSHGLTEAAHQSMAKVALEKQDSGDTFYKAKLQTARCYFAKLLPEIESCAAMVRTGLNPLMETEYALA